MLSLFLSLWFTNHKSLCHPQCDTLKHISWVALIKLEGRHVSSVSRSGTFVSLTLKIQHFRFSASLSLAFAHFIIM